jgi:Zn-dependent membrane protease YugP
MVDLLGRWWPFLLLLYVPTLARLLSNLAYHVVKSRLDHAIPDELPETAGEWLNRRIIADGLGSAPRTLVQSKDRTRNAYFEDEHVIVLSDETFFKRDPAYWAVAAHELGHAEVRARHRVRAALYRGAHLPKWALSTFGVALVIGNILYGVPGMTDLGFRCLAGALLLGGFVLVEEAHASRTAMRLLAGEPAMTPTHLRAARLTLLFALFTYVADFVARAALLACWPRVVALTGAGLLGHVADPLSGWRHTLVAIGTGVALAYALWRLFAMSAPPATRERYFLLGVALGLCFHVALLFLIIEVWDHSADSAHIWSVYLALIPAMSTVAFLAALPGLPLALLLVRVHERLLARYGGIERSTAFLDARKRGERLVRSGDSSVMEMLLRRHERTFLTGELAKLLYLPLLVSYWLR